VSMMAGVAGNTAKGAQPSSFAPTVGCREAVAGYVVDSTGDDVDTIGSVAQGRSGIWVFNTGSDIEIRVGATAVGNFEADDNWYDELGANQGDPGVDTGVGTTVFNLNDASGVTVNIYTVSTTVVTGTPSFSAIGTYTDDDKSTFFSPTASTKYGKRVDADALSFGGGANSEHGHFEIQITFRKSGYADYTINLSGQGDARAESTGGTTF